MRIIARLADGREVNVPPDLLGQVQAAMQADRQGESEEDLSELAKLPAHKRASTIQRRRWLDELHAAEKAAQGVPRGKMIQQFVADVKRRNPDAQISEKSLQRWELLYRVAGVAGLIDGRGRPFLGISQAGGQTSKRVEELPLRDLVEQAANILKVVARRLPADGKA
ncbi:MAG: hypothetical protein AMXMBFR13_29240 [Phycisphaerae bacterium]